MGTLPNDSLFADGQQWYLDNNGQSGGTPGMDLNVTSVWEDYTGEGIRVAVVDDGIDYLHPDLDDNYDQTADVDSYTREDDGAPTSSWDMHGTSVAGIIAAEANGEGSVGVAYDATLSSVRLDFGYGSLGDMAFALRQMANFDVANNSWGFVYPFSDNFLNSDFAPLGEALEYCASEGRDGLGTVMVFAGGNARLWEDNANHHNLENSRHTITVAALNHNGDYTYYSTPGADLLVSAFGGDRTTDGIVTTDRRGGKGYEKGNYTSDFGGTSSAAPMVSGVVALMLEANPDLGYRDVQEILAYSARQVDENNLSWQTNGANNANGGGLHTSTDYGFGLVDAHAAVRLAETWTAQSTFNNELSLSGTQKTDVKIRDLKTSESEITLDGHLDINQVEVTVNVDHTYIGDLELTLISPDGTESVLKTPSLYDNQEDLKFTFSSTQFWGEDTEGTWTLRVHDSYKRDEGVLKSWALQAYGDASSGNDTYVYTDEFGKLGADETRARLDDTLGIDTLNAAATTADAIIDLRPNGVSTIAGRSLTLAPNTVIENAMSGDGNDTITGNDVNNILNGGRGNDAIAAGDGNDTLIGGQGNDELTGGEGSDRFSFLKSKMDIDTITDFVSGVDKIVLSKGVFAALSSAIDEALGSEFDQVADDAKADLSDALIVYSKASGSLFYNANGSVGGMGGGGQFANLAGTPDVAADDFMISA